MSWRRWRPEARVGAEAGGQHHRRRPRHGRRRGTGRPDAPHQRVLSSITRLSNWPRKTGAGRSIGQPTGLRIRTLVGQTNSAFQANLRPEGYGWRLDTRSPGGHLFDDMVQQVRHGSVVARPRHHVRPGRRPAARSLHGAVRGEFFEYEDPDGAGTMRARTPRSSSCVRVITGRTSLRDHRGRRADLGHPGHGRDARLPPVMLFTGNEHERTTTEFRASTPTGVPGFVRSSQHFVTIAVNVARRRTCHHEIRAKVLQLLLRGLLWASEIGGLRRPRAPSRGPVTPTGWPTGQGSVNRRVSPIERIR